MGVDKFVCPEPSPRAVAAVKAVVCGPPTGDFRAVARAVLDADLPALCRQEVQRYQDFLVARRFAPGMTGHQLLAEYEEYRTLRFPEAAPEEMMVDTLRSSPAMELGTNKCLRGCGAVLTPEEDLRSHECFTPQPSAEPQMTHDKMRALIQRVMPEPEKLKDLDTTREGEVRFSWVRSRFAVRFYDGKIHVERVEGGFLVSDDLALIVEHLLRETATKPQCVTPSAGERDTQHCDCAAASAIEGSHHQRVCPLFVPTPTEGERTATAACSLADDRQRKFTKLESGKWRCNACGEIGASPGEPIFHICRVPTPSAGETKPTCACGDRGKWGEHSPEKCVWDNGSKFYPANTNVAVGARPEGECHAQGPEGHPGVGRFFHPLCTKPKGHSGPHQQYNNPPWVNLSCTACACEKCKAREEFLRLFVRDYLWHVEGEDANVRGRDTIAAARRVTA